MSAFSSLSAAEIRAEAQVLAGAWIEAHCCLNRTGVIAVRLLRKKDDTATTFDSQTGGGSWDEVTDDTTA